MVFVASISPVLLFMVAVQVGNSNAWLLPWKADEVDGKSIADSKNEILPGSSSANMELLEEDGLELEDIETEQNLKCFQDFNKNLFKVLRSLSPNANATERLGRQDDDTELVASLLNLEFPQILVPVLKIVTSAAANNATAIDENYKDLPFAVRSQVTDLIQFVADVITTT